MSTRIEIVVFDGFDEMDAIAPYEVFRTAAGYGAPIEVELVGAHGRRTITASHGTRILVERGPSVTADVDPRPRRRLLPRRRHPRRAGARRPAARCSRTRTRAASSSARSARARCCSPRAGLTAGRRATTHHLAMDDLRASGAEVVEARFVDDGDIVTAGGVTSGLDLALHLVERFADARDRRARGGRDRVRAAGRGRRISCRR